MAKRDYTLTEAKIARFLEEGRGAGEGADYRPWLTIHDVPSTGLCSRVKGRKHGRTHHLLSGLERDAFFECDWSEDVVDIREQFPLDRDRTRAIAADMGVRHPSIRGVDQVMTTDLLLRLRRDVGSAIVAIAAKHSALLGEKRTLEKLEIERRYWLADGIPWRLVTERQMNRSRVKNLQWLHEWYWIDQQEVPYEGYWEDRCRAFLAALASYEPSAPLDGLFRRLEEVSHFREGEAISALRHLGAHRRVLIDVDATFAAKGPASRVRLPHDSGQKAVRAAA